MSKKMFEEIENNKALATSANDINKISKQNSNMHLNTKTTQSRSSSLSPSDIINDKIKVFSFPWRRRSTSFNMKPKWAFRRFR